MRARESRHNEIPPALLALFHQTNRPRRAVQLRLRAADSILDQLTAAYKQAQLKIQAPLFGQRSGQWLKAAQV